MATTRQKIAIKNVLNGTTIKKSMEIAKYSPTTAATTGKLTRTKGWKELMEKHLPDKLLAKKHLEGLEATTKKPHLIDRDDKGRPVYDYVPEDDYSTRHKYLDSAYKIKSKYPKESQEGNKTLVVVISGESAQRYDIPVTPITKGNRIRQT